MKVSQNITALTNEDNGIVQETLDMLTNNMEYKGLPDVDEYNSMLLTWNSAMCIAQKLHVHGVCAFGASVGAGTAFNIMVADMKKSRELPWALGDRMPWLNACGDLYISIERFGGFSFRISDPEGLKKKPEAFVHEGYFEEKLGHRFGDVVSVNLVEFFGMVIHCLERLKT